MSKLEPDFTTTIGDDIKVAVKGEYSAPDASCNFGGGYNVMRVWIETDLAATDLSSLLSDEATVRIRHEGFLQNQPNGYFKKGGR